MCADALQLARHFPPDIVVLDVNLPGMNGLEVCRQLKAAPGTRALPVVFCSGERHLAEDAMDLGAAAFLAKPDDILKLPECLHAILCHARDGDESRQTVTT
jgi:CheY-like chemotaxis protein